MPFIPTPNGAKVVMPFVAGDQRWTNTLWFIKVGFTPIDMIELGDEIVSCWFDAFDDLLSDTVSYGKAQVYDMRTIGGIVVESDIGPMGGEDVAEMLSPSASLCLTLRTAGRGRFARGRLYLAGFTEGQIGDGGRFSGTLSTAAGEFLSCLIGLAVSIGWTLVIRSIQEDKVTQDPAVTRAVTTGGVRDTLQASQRRRTGRT